MQGARSGLLPVSYLQNGDDAFTNCIGLFAAYDQENNRPIEDANATLVSFGYNVSGAYAPVRSGVPAHVHVCCPGLAGRRGGVLRLRAVPQLAAVPPCLLAQCDTLINQIEETWKVRVSIIVYAMAVVATLGWVLFMVFGGIGLVALPIDWIRQFIRRPRATITRSQYIDRARDLARRAKDILGLADALKREERERGRSWRWRRNTKALHNQLLVLEEDEAALELVYPQVKGGGARVRVAWGYCPVAASRLYRQADQAHTHTLQSEDPDYKWVLTVLGFWLMLFGGLLGLALSICWVLQIILYVLIDPPVTPLLNEVFIK